MAVVAPGLTETEALQQPDVPGITRPMTYEEYISGPEEMARYDIIDGWKVYRLYGKQQLANPTREHQEIALNLAECFRAYQRSSQRGRTIMAPCDVRLTKRPLRSRQPDVLFISNERLAKNPSARNAAPLSPAPELVVEVISPSDRPSVLAAKIADYRSVDVQEVWVVRSAEQSIEVVGLTPEEIETLGQFARGQQAMSRAFPGLSVDVDAVFG